MTTKRELLDQIGELEAEIEQLKARIAMLEAGLTFPFCPAQPRWEPVPLAYPWHRYTTDDNTSAGFRFAGEGIDIV